MKIWWQEEDWDIGWYHLMFDDREWARICYIPVKYKKWSANERKRCFNDGLYEAGYCLDGCSSSWVLKARTLDEAKKELLQYFIDYYKDRIKSAKNTVKSCEIILKELRSNEK